MTRALLSWPDPGPILDISVHLGTLAAVLIYFRHDTRRLFFGLVSLCRWRDDSNRALFLNLTLATVPVLVFAAVLLLTDLIAILREPMVIAVATIVFAIPLWLTDRYCALNRGFADLRRRDYLLVGLAQALALIPGTSRAGICITAGRALGISRDSAARLAMLMSIPTILVFGGYAVANAFSTGDLDFGLDLLIAAGFSFATALLAIWGLMSWLRRSSYTVFVIYRLALGGALMVWLLS